ncbi:hypothetical protein DM860_006136 [Cuscuta australis]|uniref:Uncharacterized protein n=1 Tax=Cuscuta australis TaxID=267555 RepID=A0A328DJL5_9ASTE|nr:hypothetical protein DM860_006136 [Cuscuta australis]
MAAVPRIFRCPFSTADLFDSAFQFSRPSIPDKNQQEVVHWHQHYRSDSSPESGRFIGTVKLLDKAKTGKPKECLPSGWRRNLTKLDLEEDDRRGECKLDLVQESDQTRLRVVVDSGAVNGEEDIVLGRWAAK